MDGKQIFKQKSGLDVQEVENDLLILDQASGQIHQLNASAAMVWKLCDGRQHVENIVENFIARFNIDMLTAWEDIDAILAQLVSLKLVEPQ